MKTWIRNYKATKQLEEYAVIGFNLVEDAWYGKDGMSDCRGTLPLGEYRLEIMSWGEDKYRRKIASDAWSEIQMVAEFKSKVEANKAWKKIVETRPSWKELEEMGFRRQR